MSVSLFTCGTLWGLLVSSLVQHSQITLDLIMIFQDLVDNVMSEEMLSTAEDSSGKLFTWHCGGKNVVSR